MIERILQNELKNATSSNKVCIVLGPRQVGKTTMLRKHCEKLGKYLFLDGDQIDDRNVLENQNLENFKRIIGDNKVLFIDEAQRVRDIGLSLKIIHDQLPGIKLYVSGSSSLELANTINEPLTGRKIELKMFPIAWSEWEKYMGVLKAKKQLNDRLIYGMYPDILMNQGKELDILNELTQSYLYRDLLSFAGIRKPQLLSKLLQALAFQIGNEVSLNELARMLEVSKETVDSYIDLLEKAFIIFKLNPLSRNTRKEIATSRKIYFYDNGIRNAVIGNFKSIDLRNDAGPLWENFLIAERMKVLSYNKDYGQSYFWRTYSQQEIDYIEEKDGEIRAYEFKWNPRKSSKFSSTFTDFYNPISTQVVNSSNFHEFLTTE